MDVYPDLTGRRLLSTPSVLKYLLDQQPENPQQQLDVDNRDNLDNDNDNNLAQPEPAAAGPA